MRRNELFGVVVGVIPGIVFLTILGLAARTLSTIVPIHHLILAIVLGAAITNVGELPESLQSGVDTYKLWLETGIVLMGSRLVLGEVITQGPILLALVFGAILVSICCAELLSRRAFNLDDRMGSLIAAGVSLCGISAVVAVAGSIKARQEQIAYAVGTILLFDAITIFIYPLIGETLALPDRTFGIWAGLTMFSTGPVTAAGFGYSESAGRWAVVTKLTRNALIGIVAVGYSIYYARTATEAFEAPISTPSAGVRHVWQTFPKFVVGFVVVMVLASTGILSETTLASMENAYRWLFLLSFAGLGMNLRLVEMRTTGTKPIAATLLTLVFVSTLSLLVLLLVL